MHNQKQAIKSKATNLNKIGKRASCQLLALLALTAPANAFDLKLTAPDGSERDFFGGSVALRDNLALIGAPLDDDNARNSGSAYLFDTTTGSLLQKFTAPDGSDGDIFGNSVALSDNLALIGAPGDDDKGTDSGSTYLFDTTTGSLLQKFIAPDGFSAGVFGGSLTLRDNLALIGAPGDQENGILSGSAYLFDTSTGSLLQKFTAPDGSDEDLFGFSVALSDNLALIGALTDNDNGRSSGSTYLFDTTTGSLLQKFTAPDGSEFNFFGNSVALSDRLALIGASGDDDNGRSSGSTYLFDTTTGSLLQKLTAPDGSEGDIFGNSVALSDRLALIGAPADQDNGENSGSAYLFDITTGSLLQKFTPPDGSDGDLFGGLIALRDNLALIGAPGDQDNGENSGSAYLFTINPQPTPEPSSLLGIAGTVAIAALSRKKQQKK
ncbi:FG-GAP repeat protein [Okeania hirsuta]|uniref:FG-GAP repeat protein n=1 Tax=Okeania hirsuta TaxID=1458930 RepID=UPI000F52D447|nr:FG-GAP repeat protein [Okeania hirsuta]RQH22587.1 PEP-CTERM sorting domain-containing protein [Okeania hirsuta]